jgi:hypothetical protein
VKPLVPSKTAETSYDVVTELSDTDDPTTSGSTETAGALKVGTAMTPPALGLANWASLQRLYAHRGVVDDHTPLVHVAVVHVYVESPVIENAFVEPLGTNPDSIRVHLAKVSAPSL